MQEEMVKYVLNYVIDELPEEMAFLSQFVDKGLMDRLNNVRQSEFGRITYTEAIELLKQAGQKFEFPVAWGMDLQTEHERYLTEKVFQKPVFVTDYPAEIKAFYMRQNDDGKTVAAMDLLVPGVGELIGGSQRKNATTLLNKIHELPNEQDYWWYLELRKYGGVKHPVSASARAPDHVPDRRKHPRCHALPARWATANSSGDTQRRGPHGPAPLRFL